MEKFYIEVFLVNGLFDRQGDEHQCYGDFVSAEEAERALTESGWMKKGKICWVLNEPIMAPFLIQAAKIVRLQPADKLPRQQNTPG